MIPRLLKETVSEWLADKCSRLGAALAFYTLFSLASLVIIFITIAGLVFSNAEAQVMSQIADLLGENSIAAIKSMVSEARKPATSITATALGLVTLLFGATGVFIQLKDALNTIWDVEPVATTVASFAKKYFLSFTVVLGIGFLLLVSLLLSAALSIAGEFLKAYAPEMGFVMKVTGFVVSFAIVSCLFAFLFKSLPDKKIPWRDVWLGGVITAFLFAVGKYALGAYLGRKGVASAYGAAGSLVLILLWVYYSAQILFFGAEFTEVYSRYYGSRRETEIKETPVTRKEKLVAEIERERRRLTQMARPLGRFQRQRKDYEHKRFEL